MLNSFIRHCRIPPRISFDLSYTMNSEPDSVSMELKIDGSIFNQAATKLLDSAVTTDDNNLIKDTQDLLAGIQGRYENGRFLCRNVLTSLHFNEDI